jgi:glycosyltransferase involved in cell wall biosynthesis
MSRLMRVSVIIPCHNAGRWIGETLQSVAAQTLRPAEVIVVDDASTDDSAEQIRRSGIDVRIIPVRCRNAAAARNAGIEVATGDWIALLDADDVWYPNHLERAAEVLAGTDDVAYRAMCDDITADGARVPLTIPQPITTTRTGITHGESIEFENRELYFGHSSVLYRRDRFREVGGFAPAQVRRHDIDLWLRMIHNQTWTWDALPTVAYRLDTPGSICRNYAECEYYALRALVRNKDAYRGPAMDELLAKTARKVMTLGFADGTPEQYRRYRELAWPYLPARLRAVYRVAGLLPPVSRGLIRAKRALFTWRTGYAMELPSCAPEARS